MRTRFANRVCLALTLILALAVGAESGESICQDLGNPDPVLREKARRAVAAAGEVIVPELIRLLRGLDTIAAREAATCLGEIGTSDARGPLHRALSEAPPAVRVAAARALGRMGDFRDVRPLTQALASVPEAAARALGRLGSDRAVEPLRAALKTSKGPARIEILAALATLGCRDCLPMLIARLGSDDAMRSRSLVRLREITGCDAGSDATSWQVWWRRDELSRHLASARREDIQALVTELENPEGERRQTVLSDLRTFVVDSERSEATRGRAILLLGLVRDRNAFDALLSVLEGPRGQVRSYAAEALGRLGDARAVLPLARQIVAVVDPDRAMAGRAMSGKGPYYIVDAESAKSLVRMGLVGGLRIAIENLFLEWRIRMYYESIVLLRTTTGQNMDCRPDMSPEDRKVAARRWMRWFRENACSLDLPRTIDFDDPGLQAGIDRLVARLGVYKFLTSDTAKRILMVVGEPARSRVERALLENPSMHARVHAAEILAEVGHPDSVAHLARAVKEDTDAAVRSAAAAALGLIGPRAGDVGATCLRRALTRDGETADVRTAAAEALGLVSDESSDAELLNGLLAAPGYAGPALCLAVARAMARLGNAAGMDALVPFLASDDPVERREAVTVLREVTGRAFGFDPEGAAGEREAATARWMEHGRSNRTILRRDARGYVRVTFLTAR